MKLAIFLISSSLFAQTKLSNPAIILPPANRTTGSSLEMQDSTSKFFVGLLTPTTLPVTVISAATNANPMVLTTATVMTIQTGSVIVIEGAAGTGCSIMNGPQTVSSVTGTSVTLGLNGTGCTYTASSASAATSYWAMPGADAAGCWQSNGASVLSIGSCGGITFVNTSPSGVCTNTPPMQYNYTNGSLWACEALTWTQINSSSGNLVFVTSDPSGSCTSGTTPMQYNTNDGLMWGCESNTWVNIFRPSPNGTDLGTSSAFFGNGFIQNVITDEVIFDSGATNKFHMGYDAITGALALVNNISQILWEFNASPGQVSYGSIVTNVNDTFNLGSPSDGWSTLYLGSGGIVLNGASNPNAGSAAAGFANIYSQDFEVIFSSAIKGTFGYDNTNGAVALTIPVLGASMEWLSGGGIVSYENIWPSSANSLTLGTRSLYWQEADVSTLYGPSGLTINANGGGIQLPGYSDGCLERIAGFIGSTGTACSSVPGAWTAYTPSTTNLSGVSADAAYSCSGKTCNVRIGVLGTAVATGTISVGLPFTPADSNQAPACFVITSGTYAVQPCVLSGSTIVNEGNWTISTTHTYIFSLTYETT